MISIKYVNGLCTDKEVMEPFVIYNEAVNDVTADLESLISNKKLKIESSLFGSILDDNNDELIDEAVNDIIQKIGKVIIEISEKFVKMIKSVVEKISNIGFNRKNDVQKIDKLIAKHPELKDQIIAHWKSGDLELSDMKSLADLDEQFDQLVELANRKNVNPNSFKEKCKRLLRKIDEKPTIKNSLVLMSTAITLALAVKTFKGKMYEANVNCHDNESASIRMRSRMVDAIRDSESRGESNNDPIDRQGVFSLLLNVYRALHNKHQQSIGHDLNVIQRMNNAIAGALDNVTRTRIVTGLYGGDPARIKVRNWASTVRITEPPQRNQHVIINTPDNGIDINANVYVTGGRVNASIV